MCLYPDVLFFGMTFCKRDILRYYFPIWHFMISNMKEGIIPLWNPLSNLGTPFMANIQSCVFYPLTLILYLPDYVWGFNFYILVHLALASFFTYLWMRDNGTSFWGSFLAGAAFGLSGYVQSTINLTISLTSLVYLPLVLLCLRRALRGGGRTWIVATSLTLAVQYLAGDPAVLFGTLVVCSVLVLFRTLEHVVGRRGSAMRSIGVFASVIALFAAMVLFQMLAFAELLGRSNRAGLGYDDVTMWSMQYNDLLSFAVPYFSDTSMRFMDYWVRQSWFENSYVGVTVLFLALVAVRRTFSDRQTGLLVLMAILGLALALGRFCAIHRLFYDYFPFFRFIRYPARFLFIFTFATACLSGVGFDALLRARQKPRSLWPLVPILAGVLVFALWQAFTASIELSFYRSIHEIFDKLFSGAWHRWETVEMVYPVLFNMKRSLVFLLFASMAYVAATRLPMRRVIALVFLGSLVFTDLAETNAVEFRVERGYLERVGRNMSYVRRDPGLFRVNASPSAMNFQMNTPDRAESISENLDHLLEVFSPNMHLLSGVAYTQSYDSISVKDFIDLNDRAHTVTDPASHRYLDMMNIKYVVSLKQDLGSVYRHLQYATPAYLYENTRVLPRAFLVSAFRVESDRKALLDKVVSAAFDPQAALWLDEAPGEDPDRGEVGADEKVEIVRYGTNTVRMHVRAAAPRWLFFSDLYYPGWKASVNGVGARIHRANYCFRAIRVPAGDSEVVWNYRPDYLLPAALVSAAAWMIALFLLASGRSRRRR